MMCLWSSPGHGTEVFDFEGLIGYERDVSMAPRSGKGVGSTVVVDRVQNAFEGASAQVTDELIGRLMPKFVRVQENECEISCVGSDGV